MTFRAIPIDKIIQEFCYDKDTGIFTRKTKGTKSKVGYMGPDGYLVINFNRTRYPAHRIAYAIVYGDPGEKEIDHINHNRSDNRICNLRVVDRQGNSRNSTTPNTNTSGYKGVRWTKNKWEAYITIDRKYTHLGRFDSINDAINARNMKEHELGWLGICGNTVTIGA